MKKLSILILLAASVSIVSAMQEETPITTAMAKKGIFALQQQAKKGHIASFLALQSLNTLCANAQETLACGSGHALLL